MCAIKVRICFVQRIDLLLDDAILHLFVLRDLPVEEPVNVRCGYEDEAFEVFEA